jgi:hypothetical protein
MLEDSLYAKRCKANLVDVFFERQIPNTPFCCKTQKYEPLHNYQEKVAILPTNVSDADGLKKVCPTEGMILADKV